MRWTRGRRSKNVEDRRFQTGRGRAVKGTGLGLGGLVILLLLSLFTGQDFLSLFGGTEALVPTGQPGGQAGPRVTSPEEEELAEFLHFLIDDIQEEWHRLLPQVGGTYRDATLVLFRDATQSACGVGRSSTGPFYCPGDQNVYIDLSFYDQLQDRFGAPGDFAQAYVIAHEIGHHVQTLLGIERQVREVQRADPRLRNQYSIAMELQADCLAGVWGYTANRDGILERGDIEEGLRAASAIGDDRIQRQTTGYVSPETWTHGSSEERAYWLARGLESGDPDFCDTFAEMER